jgi:Asp-tRNA(Asn)/Glu-tRNA(Gln) amidotransferase A subunit family amidase
MASFGVSTDTNGCARIPAALTGVVAFRPTLARYSLDGVYAPSSTKSTVALVARTVAEVQLVDDVLLRPTLHSKADREMAATKIQAVTRGKRERQRVAAIRAAAKRRVEEEDGDDAEDGKSVDSLDSTELAKQERSAVMIQVPWRCRCV